MSGVKLTNERPAWPIPDTSSTDGAVDDENVDWEPATGGTVENDQWKQPVRAATTATVTIATALNAGDTIDGVTLVAGDRVLVKDQSTASENGIYIAGTTPERAPDLDDDDEVLGAVVYVIAGTANTGTTWAVTNTTATVVDTDAIDWAVFSGGGATPASGPYADWLNVEDYGAVHDGATDDTSAIQAAIDDAMTAGGGTVYFPAGVYAISGALQDTSVRNAQLVIPQNAVSGSAPPVAIAFIGEGPTGQWNHGTSGAWDPGTNGAILLSNWAGVISGQPAVLSAAKYDAVYPAASFNWIEVTFRDIEIRCPANPKLSGIQMAGTASVHLDNVTVSTDTDSASMVLPSNTNATGFVGPLIGNANPPYLLNNVFVDGFYTGIALSEVAHLAEVAVHHCTIGIALTGPQNHTISAERILFVAVKTGIKITGGTFYLNIADLHIEHSIGSGTFQRVYDVDDGSNYGVGFITFHTVKAGVGPDDDLSVNGGTHLHTRSIDSGTWGTSSFATPSIVLGSSAAAGAASTVIRSDSTIAAFDATVPVTQAFSDAAATGSAAFAARRDHVHGMPATPSSGGASEHVHVVSETHLSDGSTVTWTLDNAFEPGSVIAWNTTTLARLGVTEVQPDQATVSAAGTTGDSIVFDYAATLA